MLLETTEFRYSFDTYDHRDAHVSFVTLAECAAASGLQDEARAILDSARWSIPAHPFPDVGGRIVTGLRAAALRCVLNDAEPDRMALWRADRKSTRLNSSH